MNSTGTYQRPVVICRWPGRPQEDKDLATRILSTLKAVETTMDIGLAWSADIGSADEFTMIPFRTDLEPVDVELEPFLKLDDDNNVWKKGGLALPLYGSVTGMPEGEIVSVTGTVGATTRWGNSIQITFLTDDPQTIPTGDELTALVEAVGEIWEADWCAALSDELVDEVNRPVGEPGIGLVTYWADSIQPTLPASDGVTIRKTGKGVLAEISGADNEIAIAYARTVYAARS